MLVVRGKFIDQTHKRYEISQDYNNKKWLGGLVGSTIYWNIFKGKIMIDHSTEFITDKRSSWKRIQNSKN